MKWIINENTYRILKEINKGKGLTGNKIHIKADTCLHIIYKKLKLFDEYNIVNIKAKDERSNIVSLTNKGKEIFNLLEEIKRTIENGYKGYNNSNC